MKTIVVAAALQCLSGIPACADHELDNRDLISGEKLYADNCAVCHGANLQGQPNWQSPDENGVLPAPPHDKSGHTWHHDNALLFEYTKLGGQGALGARGVSGFNSGMDGFGDVLTDDEIWDVLAYIRSTWPKRQQDVQGSRNSQH
ncbi:MAG: cytochrome c [Amylibacter sp.]|nr:cytochrome c [Amylibacter sp.]